MNPLALVLLDADDGELLGVFPPGTTEDEAKIYATRFSAKNYLEIRAEATYKRLLDLDTKAVKVWYAHLERTGGEVVVNPLVGDWKWPGIDFVPDEPVTSRTHRLTTGTVFVEVIGWDREAVREAAAKAKDWLEGITP